MIKIQEHIALAPYTTFRIGGEARFFAEVASLVDIEEAFAFAIKNNIQDIFLLGGGSNVLFSDKGYTGLVIYFAPQKPRVEGNTLQCSSGTILYDLVESACKSGLRGLENLSGIPGTVGGAIRGNAGAFGMEIRDRLVWVKAYNTKTKKVKKFSKEECALSYRQSFFKMRPEWIIVEAFFELQEGEVKKLIEQAEKIEKQRNDNHPQDALCAGSFFVNPRVEDKTLREQFEKEYGVKSRENKLPAGWIIDKAGLRGKKVGGAQISKKHTNYLINTGNATAKDVIDLMNLVQKVVSEKLDVRLQAEPQIVGYNER